LRTTHNTTKNASTHKTTVIGIQTLAGAKSLILARLVIEETPGLKVLLAAFGSRSSGQLQVMKHACCATVGMNFRVLTDEKQQ
jgi:hypothetical protein